jgi:RimJ/RimL family protein N-acetyltransferase
VSGYIWPVLTIRRARIDDVPELARVHYESSEAAYQGLAPLDAARLSRREAAWSEVFAKPECAPFIAEADGQVVGVLNVGPARDESGVGEVYVIYVHPAWWGTEAGQRLLECAHDELSRKYEQAVLTVLAANPRARRFYERNGWQLDRVKTEPHFGGTPTEVALYRKRFGAHE